MRGGGYGYERTVLLRIRSRMAQPFVGLVCLRTLVPARLRLPVIHSCIAATLSVVSEIRTIAQAAGKRSAVYYEEN